MRNTYERRYIVINEPVVDKHRRKLFERKINAAADQGFQPVGLPTFYVDRGKPYGVTLMKKSQPIADADEFLGNVKSKKSEKTKRRKCPS